MIQAARTKERMSLVDEWDGSGGGRDGDEEKRAGQDRRRRRMLRMSEVEG
jgi:hypothetical protein